MFILRVLILILFDCQENFYEYSALEKETIDDKACSSLLERDIFWGQVREVQFILHWKHRENLLQWKIVGDIFGAAFRERT